MNTLFPALVIVLASVLVTEAARLPRQTYTTKYDNINLDDILNNDRLLKKYHQCLVEDSDRNCTPDGLELKKNIPDAIITDCSKCTPKQKEGANKVIKFLVTKKPELWKSIQVKYDPEDSFLKKHPEITAA